MVEVGEYDGGGRESLMVEVGESDGGGWASPMAEASHFHL